MNSAQMEMLNSLICVLVCVCVFVRAFVCVCVSSIQTAVPFNVVPLMFYQIQHGVDVVIIPRFRCIQQYASVNLCRCLGDTPLYVVHILLCPASSEQVP